MDAQLQTAGGDRVPVTALWGRPTVLFYEDRGAGPVNQHVKDQLLALLDQGKAQGLLDEVSVIAVASVTRFDWFPARELVLAAGRELAEQLEVPFYLDFEGALSEPPWRLPRSGSTVAVLSPHGEVVWRATGRLTEVELDQLFARLGAQRALGDAPS